jgi:mannose-1-phosphate guanylyltransferase/mannose-6-phosphate isomerase
MEYNLEHVYAVILAGGSGTRFWPKSRHLRPKQLCKIGDDQETMIEKTLSRLDSWIPPERRLLVTHEDQVKGTQSIVKDRCPVILGEPLAKNTAPALMIAALEIMKIHQGPKPPVMISLHADHLIKNQLKFKETLLSAVQIAEKGQLTLVGINPEYPETGYGYIEMGAPHHGIKNGFHVASFREKPNHETASFFVQSGKFLWNSGLFIWQVPRILEELEWALKGPLHAMQSLFNTYGSYQKIPTSVIRDTYEKIPKISIDHAVLETSKQVSVVSTDMGWQDVGSWSALEKAFPSDINGNIIFGDGCALDTQNTTIDTDGPFVATLGVEDLVVVASMGAVLVCPKSRSQDVKDVVQWLEKNGRKQLL